MSHNQNPAFCFPCQNMCSPHTFADCSTRQWPGSWGGTSPPRAVRPKGAVAAHRILRTRGTAEPGGGVEWLATCPTRSPAHNRRPPRPARDERGFAWHQRKEKIREWGCDRGGSLGARASRRTIGGGRRRPNRAIRVRERRGSRAAQRAW
jgi:hypothetical protein